MYTLSIPEIFSNFSFYKENYLEIIQSSEQYFTEVDGAFIDVWPFKKQSLYLGDLLQLWFAEKWRVDLAPAFEIEQYLAAVDVHTPHIHSVYIYAISANILNGFNSTLLWNQQTQQQQWVDLNSTLKNYCEFIACQRPQLLKDKFYRTA